MLRKEITKDLIDRYTFLNLFIAEESIENPSTPDNVFAPKTNTGHLLSKVKFNGYCLKQDSMSFLQKNVVNLYIIYKLDIWSRDLNTDFTLGNYLFGAVKLTNNADPGKCGFSGYGFGFDARSQFLWSDCSWGKNVIIFGADMSSAVHVDNKNKIKFQNF